VSDDLAATAAVVVDAPIGRLDRQSTRRAAGHDGVKAPAFVVDLDDVSGVDALEPHRPPTVGLIAVRWLVDGMNVIGTRPDAWWKDRHSAMVRLVDMLERWAASSGADITVVFEQPPSPPIRSTVIAVTHAPRPRRDSADDEIVRMLLADPEPRAIRVVTSDLWLSDRVHAAGATVEPAAAFRALIEDA
jgi:predicted RNA-binding protein with PIN domain